MRLRSLVASSAAALLYISGVAAPAEAATSSYGYFGPVAGHNYRDYYYNPNGTQYVLSDAANASCGPGPYSSQGVVKAWNGTSYGAWYTFSSPFQNF